MEKMTKAKRESNSLYQVLFPNAADALLILSPGGDIIDINHRAMELYNYSQDELAGKNIAEIWLEPQLNLNECLADQGHEIQLSGEHRRKDGSRFSAQVAIYKTELESQPFFLAIIRSSSADYNHQGWVLQQQIEYLKVFSENINEMFFIYDLDSRISYMNPRFIEKMGYSNDDVIGEKLLDFIPPEYHSEVQKEIQDRLIKGIKNTFYTKVLIKDSRQMIIRVKSSPIMENGIIVGGMCLAEDMTEKIQQEEAIKKSEEQLRQITDNIIDIVCKTDTRARIEYLSPSVFKVLGYKPEEMLGKSLFDNIHPEDIEKVAKIINDCISAHKSSEIEHRYRNREGHHIWMESIGIPLFDDAGNFIGAIIVSRDINHRKQTEAALRKSEGNFRALFNTMQEGFALWEIVYNEKHQLVDMKFIEVNPTFEKNIGISRSELIGKRITEQKIFIEDYWFTIFNKVLKKGQSQEFEGYFSHLNSYFELFIFQPEPSNIACLVVDISARRRAEKELANEKEWLAVTLGSIAEGVIATDAFGKVLFLNPSAAEMLGWTQENAIGKHLSDLLNEVENMYGFKEYGDEIKDEPGWHEAELNDNMLCIVRNGIRRYLSNSAATIRDKEGNDLGMVMVLGDITEKKKTDEKIQYLSYNDKLTGLYNRAYIDIILNNLDDQEKLPVSLIMGDINGLKLTNDVFGHQEGDRLLVKVAKILKISCRDNDVVARWGGDEFLIVLPRTDAEVAQKVCERIRRTCNEAETDPIAVSIALGSATRDNMQQDISGVFILAEERMYSNKFSESQVVRSEIIAGLEKTLCERSCENEEHSLRMKEMALEIARYLNLDKGDMDKLALLASLHDIGNVAISQEILMKVEPLDTDDWDRIRRHPEIGYRMAQSIPELRSIAEAILCHHEHWDGTGYPQGLSGIQIPILARIISVIDAYDVMTHDCVYKKAVTSEQALQELSKCSGTQFDPHIVDVFINGINNISI